MEDQFAMEKFFCTFHITLVSLTGFFTTHYLFLGFYRYGVDKLKKIFTVVRNK